MVHAAATAWRFPIARASCPAGKKLVGGGGRCVGGFVFLIENLPENDITWKVHCDSTKEQNVEAEAFALCQ